MLDEVEIFKHVMKKKIENTEFRREIAIFEEGPFVFRVVQELQPVSLENNLPVRSEWICSSRESATEQALRCLHQSKNDNWQLSASASSAA